MYKRQVRYSDRRVGGGGGRDRHLANNDLQKMRWVRSREVVKKSAKMVAATYRVRIVASPPTAPAAAALEKGAERRIPQKAENAE